MKRELVFDGEKGPMRLRLLWSMVGIGIAMLSKADKRTTDDMRREGDLQSALEGVSVEWEQAKELGVAPKDLLDQERIDRAVAVKKGEPLDEWNPRVVTGERMRFLKPDAVPVLLPAKTFERLEELVGKAAPHTHSTQTRDAVDVLDFLTAARKIES